ncbi:hypothetical protein U0070_024800, partial [Myodes glareolus]
MQLQEKTSHKKQCFQNIKVKYIDKMGLKQRGSTKDFILLIINIKAFPKTPGLQKVESLNLSRIKRQSHTNLYGQERNTNLYGLGIILVFLKVLRQPKAAGRHSFYASVSGTLRPSAGSCVEIMPLRDKFLQNLERVYTGENPVFVNSMIKSITLHSSLQNHDKIDNKKHACKYCVFTEEKITILISNMEKSSLSIFTFRAMKELKVTVIYIKKIIYAICREMDETGKSHL